MLTVLVLASCGGEAGELAAPDAALPAVDAALSVVCTALHTGVADVDLETLHDRLLGELWGRGLRGANGETGPDALYVRNIGSILNGADIGAAAIEWLEGLPEVAFAGAELVVSNQPADWSTAQSASLVVLRARVGAVAARFARPAATLSMQREAGGWRIFSLVVWPSVALAGGGEAAALAACTREAPPDERALRAHRFEGLRFRGCAETGTYGYTPQVLDQVAWQAPVTWEALDDAGTWRGRPTRWRIIRPATLTIARENYFSAIEEADCMCGDRAGWQLVVDTVTGAVVRYTPGINCVVC